MRSAKHVGLALLLCASAVIAGCATRSGYYYGGSGYGDPYAYREPRPADSRYYDPGYQEPRYSDRGADERYCQRVAEDVSGEVVTEGAKGALAGGALGAAVGAAAGAIAGDAGKGAAIGAATGGIGGAVVQGTRRNRSYDDVFVTCMRDRGYRIY